MLIQAALETKGPGGKIKKPQVTTKRSFENVVIKKDNRPRWNGKIVGKFDNGYLVRVEMGSKSLHGVIYHSTSTASVRTVSDTVTLTLPLLIQKDNWREKDKSCDKSYPKPYRSEYNVYFADQNAKLKVSLCRSHLIDNRSII